MLTLGFLLFALGGDPSLVGAWELVGEVDEATGEPKEERLFFYPDGQFLITGDGHYLIRYAIDGSALTHIFGELRFDRSFQLEDNRLRFFDEDGDGYSDYRRLGDPLPDLKRPFAFKWKGISFSHPVHWQVKRDRPREDRFQVMIIDPDSASNVLLFKETPTKKSSGEELAWTQVVLEGIIKQWTTEPAVVENDFFGFAGSSLEGRAMLQGSDSRVQAKVMILPRSAVMILVFSPYDGKPGVAAALEDLVVDGRRLREGVEKP